MLDLTDRRPIYITPDAAFHRKLSECYVQNTVTHEVRPTLILTVEEYEAACAANYLQTLITNWRNQL